MNYSKAILLTMCFFHIGLSLSSDHQFQADTQKQFTLEYKTTRDYLNTHKHLREFHTFCCANPHLIDRHTLTTDEQYARAKQEWQKQGSAKAAQTIMPTPLRTTVIPPVTYLTNIGASTPTSTPEEQQPALKILFIKNPTTGEITSYTKNA